MNINSFIIYLGFFMMVLAFSLDYVLSLICGKKVETLKIKYRIIIAILIILIALIIYFYHSNGHPPCEGSSIGFAGENPFNNKKQIIINNWGNDKKYIFYGQVSWNTNLLTTHGKIYLITPKDEYELYEWNNPGTEVFIKNVTEYIKGNGEYTIEWRYINGNAGVCILKSEIKSFEK